MNSDTTTQLIQMLVVLLNLVQVAMQQINNQYLTLWSLIQ